MSRSPTTTDADWLDAIHAGDLLLSEFIEPLGLSVAGMAEALHVSVDDLSAIIAGNRPVDAALDLRLSRYFKLSEGFFLRLQNRHDTLVAKRALNGELDRIVPLAA